jgi:hypothetical protein
MASHTNSGDEHPIPLLRFSPLSPGGSDRHATTQLHAERLAPENPTSRPATLSSDEKDDSTPALRLPLPSSDDFEEQAARPHSTGSAPTSEEARSFTPPNGSGERGESEGSDENDESDLELALTLSQLPDDIFDEQVSGLNQRRESHTPIEGSPGSLPTTLSFSEVRTTYSSYLSKPLKIVLGRHGGRFE